MGGNGKLWFISGGIIAIVCIIIYFMFGNKKPNDIQPSGGNYGGITTITQNVTNVQSAQQSVANGTPFTSLPLATQNQVIAANNAKNGPPGAGGGVNYMYSMSNISDNTIATKKINAQTLNMIQQSVSANVPQSGGNGDGSGGSGGRSISASSLGTGGNSACIATVSALLQSTSAIISASSPSAYVLTQLQTVQSFSSLSQNIQNMLVTSIVSYAKNPSTSNVTQTSICNTISGNGAMMQCINILSGFVTNAATIKALPTSGTGSQASYIYGQLSYLSGWGNVPVSDQQNIVNTIVAGINAGNLDIISVCSKIVADTNVGSFAQSNIFAACIKIVSGLTGNEGVTAVTTALDAIPGFNLLAASDITLLVNNLITGKQDGTFNANQFCSQLTSLIDAAIEASQLYQQCLTILQGIYPPSGTYNASSSTTSNTNIINNTLATLTGYLGLPIDQQTSIINNIIADIKNGPPYHIEQQCLNIVSAIIASIQNSQTFKQCMTIVATLLQQNNNDISYIEQQLSANITGFSNPPLTQAQIDTLAQQLQTGMANPTAFNAATFCTNLTLTIDAAITSSATFASCVKTINNILASQTPTNVTYILGQLNQNIAGFNLLTQSSQQSIAQLVAGINPNQNLTGQIYTICIGIVSQIDSALASCVSEIVTIVGTGSPSNTDTAANGYIYTQLTKYVASFSQDTTTQQTTIVQSVASLASLTDPVQINAQATNICISGTTTGSNGGSGGVNISSAQCIQNITTLSTQIKASNGNASTLPSNIQTQLQSAIPGMSTLALNVQTSIISQFQNFMIDPIHSTAASVCSIALNSAGPNGSGGILNNQTATSCGPETGSPICPSGLTNATSALSSSICRQIMQKIDADIAKINPTSGNAVNNVLGMNMSAFSSTTPDNCSDAGSCQSYISSSAPDWTYYIPSTLQTDVNALMKSILHNASSGDVAATCQSSTGCSVSPNSIPTDDSSGAGLFRQLSTRAQIVIANRGLQAMQFTDLNPGIISVDIMKIVVNCSHPAYSDPLWDTFMTTLPNLQTSQTPVTSNPNAAFALSAIVQSPAYTSCIAAIPSSSSNSIVSNFNTISSINLNSNTAPINFGSASFIPINPTLPLPTNRRITTICADPDGLPSSSPAIPPTASSPNCTQACDSSGTCTTTNTASLAVLCQQQQSICSNMQQNVSYPSGLTSGSVVKFSDLNVSSQSNYTVQITNYINDCLIQQNTTKMSADNPSTTCASAPAFFCTQIATDIINLASNQSSMINPSSGSNLTQHAITTANCGQGALDVNGNSILDSNGNPINILQETNDSVTDPYGNNPSATIFRTGINGLLLKDSDVTTLAQYIVNKMVAFKVLLANTRLGVIQQLWNDDVTAKSQPNANMGTTLTDQQCTTDIQTVWSGFLTSNISIAPGQDSGAISAALNQISKVQGPPSSACQCYVDQMYFLTQNKSYQSSGTSETSTTGDCYPDWQSIITYNSGIISVSNTTKHTVCDDFATSINAIVGDSSEYNKFIDTSSANASLNFAVNRLSICTQKMQAVYYAAQTMRSNASYGWSSSFYYPLGSTCTNPSPTPGTSS